MCGPVRPSSCLVDLIYHYDQLVGEEGASCFADALVCGRLVLMGYEL